MSLLSPSLEAFIAVAHHKTVHGAASAIHLTQTAVTQRIRVLEAKLKTTLFIRTRRGMLLTSEGEALLRYCKAVREMEGEALAHITGAGRDSPIEIGITGATSVMSSRIIPQCIPIMKKFPQLLMRFEVDDSEERVKKLKSGACQLAILQEDELAHEMEHKPLKSEHYYLVATPEWEKRPLVELIHSERIIDFNPADRMTFNYLHFFGLDAGMRRDRYFVNRTDSLVKLIAAGFGYGVLTSEYCKPYAEQGLLCILNKANYYENKQVLAWYSRPETPPYFRALLDAFE